VKVSSFVLGYHGCDRSLAKKIVLGEQHLDISKNTHDWLGAGAYFWEDDPKRALGWAKLTRDKPQHSKHTIKDPVVLGAIIRLGNCLDLTDAGSIALVREAYAQFADHMSAQNTPLPKNEKAYPDDEDLVKRHLDCAVINFLFTMRAMNDLPLFETVRGVFTEGRPLFPNAKIMDKTHIQICVRSPRTSVIGYFIPRFY
jgi:hypothetical protein